MGEIHRAPAFRRIGLVIGGSVHSLALCLTLLAAQVPGQPASGPGPGAAARPAIVSNAAVAYREAWDLESAKTVTTTTEEICRPGTECRMDDAWTPSETLASSLAAEQRVIDRLLAGATCETCDFGVDYSAGLDVMLPHLGRMRGSARVLAADAVRLLEAGKHDAAAERVCAIYALSRHAIDGRTYIASLISANISGIGNNVAGRLCAGGLSPAARAQIIAAMAKADRTDPMGLKRGLAGERDLMATWFARFQGPDAGKRLSTSVLVTNVGPGGPELAATLAPLDGAGVRAVSEQMLSLIDAMLDAWDKPDAAELHKALVAKARAGDFGALGKVYAGSTGSVCATHRVGVKERAETVAVLSRSAK